MPTIVTPTEIEDAWYAGDLGADPTAMPGRTKGTRRGTTEDTPWPAVTIGRPQCWDLAELMTTRGDELPAEMRLLEDASDFRLLQFACSFRPRRGTKIGWARFEIGLRVPGPEPVVAWDIFPREVTTRIERDVKLAIKPSLKLAGVEASVGSLSTDISMAKVEPTVIAYGLMESNPAWDFTEHPQVPLVGSRFGYVVAQKPKRSGALTTELRIAAEVTNRGGVFRAALRTEEGDRLSVVVCDG